ncbi:MAG: TadE/TadG family type IV pilus assembly protein [Actinomycetota bacterium]|nr:TadE/TadG family type IV pilus assembly protein [Actinomycetota bacterium]
MTAGATTTGRLGRRGADRATRTGVGPRARRARRCRGGRGAAAVETALVLPLLFTLLFGIIDLGLTFRLSNAMSNAVRTGARASAAAPRTPGFEQLALDAVLRGTDDLGNGALDYLVVFRAEPDTGLPVGGDIESCTVDCFRFDVDDVTGALVPVLGPLWSYLDQIACSGDDTDLLGVYARGHHDLAFGLLGESVTVTETAVVRLEPTNEPGLCP